MAQRKTLAQKRNFRYRVRLLLENGLFSEAQAGSAGVLIVDDVSDIGTFSFDYTDEGGTESFTLTAADFNGTGTWGTVTSEDYGWSGISKTLNGSSNLNNTTLFIYYKTMKGNVGITLDALVPASSGSTLRQPNPLGVEFNNVTLETDFPVSQKLTVSSFYNTHPAKATSGDTVENTYGLTETVPDLNQEDVLAVKACYGVSYGNPQSYAHTPIFMDGVVLTTGDADWAWESLSGWDLLTQSPVTTSDNVSFRTKNDASLMDVWLQSEHTTLGDVDRYRSFTNVHFFHRKGDVEALSAPSAVSYSTSENSTNTIATVPFSGGDGVLVFTKSGTDEALFNLDSETGAFNFITGQDIEATSSFDFVINVADDVDNYNVAVTVNLVGVDEFDPVFSSPNAVTISEGSTVVYSVVATDADAPVEPITYSITGGSDAALFAINSTTGALTLLSAAELGTYVVIIGASDANDTVTQTVTVTVVPPSFTEAFAGDGNASSLVLAGISDIDSITFDFADNRYGSGTDDIAMVFTGDGDPNWTVTDTSARFEANGWTQVKQSVTTNTKTHTIYLSYKEFLGNTVVKLDSEHFGLGTYGVIKNGVITYQNQVNATIQLFDPIPLITSGLSTGTISGINQSDVLDLMTGMADTRAFEDRVGWAGTEDLTAANGGFSHTFNTPWDDEVNAVQLLAGYDWTLTVRTKDNGADLDYEVDVDHFGSNTIAGVANLTVVSEIPAEGAFGGGFGDGFE